jgi:hypothetical protein
LAGDGWAKEQAQLREAEEAAWKARVVVADTSFHATLPTKARSSQARHVVASICCM